MKYKFHIRIKFFIIHKKIRRILHKDLYIYITTKASKIFLNFECSSQPVEEDFSRIFSILCCLFCHQSRIIKYLSYSRYFSILSGTIFRSTSEDIFNEDPVKVAERYGYDESAEREKSFEEVGQLPFPSPLIHRNCKLCAPACILRAEMKFKKYPLLKKFHS